jgi:DNA-binding MarR family transcriptional regulator
MLCADSLAKPRSMRRVTTGQYTRLLEFRTELRRFLQWSELQAKVLLAIKGHPDGDPTVGEIAGYLLLRHHSTVELIDRASRAGLVQRYSDPDDARYVRASMTATGEKKLAQLTALTVEEIRRLGPVLEALTNSETR